MDNPHNILITKTRVEDILNKFQNIGDDGERLKIKNLETFQKAFVHESYYQAVQNAILSGTMGTNTYLNFIPSESNERLEYLGDHILKSVVGRYLFERFGDEREGFLTKLKIKIEKCSMLHKIGVALGFKRFLLLSLQIENQTILDIDRGRHTPSYYEDAFEAFIGAIVVEFGERGYVYADRFVRSVIEHVIDFAEIISKNDNFKDSLQRFFQANKWKTPVYTSLNEDGPLYRKVFTRILTITEEQCATLPLETRRKIELYTQAYIQEYKTTNAQVYQKLCQLVCGNRYILGIGFGRKVVNAEQECARACMQLVGLPQDY